MVPPGGTPSWRGLEGGEDELECTLALSCCREKKKKDPPSLPPFPFPFPFPSSPSFPPVPPRAGPVGRGQAEAPSTGGDPVAAAARRRRSRAAPQDGPLWTHRFHRPSQAHPEHLGHRLDHRGHHPCHDGPGALPSHCRHHLPCTDSPHAQWHRVRQR